MENKTPIIRMDGLGKAFTGSQGTVRALEDISLEIMPGEIFGIIGLSGAGKSTLVRCMNYLEVPTEGEVYYDGKPLSEMQDAELRKVRQSMGMIFQQFNLLAQRTVLFPHGDRRDSQRRSKGQGPGTFKAGGTGGPGKRISGTAFRRPEAEGSHCQGHRHQSKGTPL